MRRHPARASVVVLFVAAVLAPGAPASAQMQLPGALGGGTGAGPGGGASGGPPPPPKPVVIEPPSEDTIVSQPLAFDGSKGEMTFARDNNGLALTKLTLAGEKTSKAGQACKVDVALAQPLAATPAGRPAGAIRYAVPLDSCPFAIDVLNGAALATATKPVCEFAAADCSVTMNGLWGPPASAISPKRAQDMQRERVRFETTMRANFHALVRKAGKDGNAVKALAREQAAFSSEREMTCRDYQQEADLGFCSTQITEARALALLAKFGPVKMREHRAAHAKAPIERSDDASDDSDAPERP